MGHAYYRQLDGLRALCIVLTVLAHIEGVPWFINGRVGVDLFFPLSGFLITTLLARENDRNGQVCLACFYIRRVFRIVPLYYLVILLYFGLAAVMWIATGTRDNLEAIGRAAPWLIAFCSELRPGGDGGTFYHAWTLGIEEKYYILWPLAFPILRRWPGYGHLLLLIAAVPLLWFNPNMMRGYVGLLAGSFIAIDLAHPRSRLRPVLLALPTHVWAAGMAAGYVASILAPDQRANLLVALPAAFFIAAIVLKTDDRYARLPSTPLLWRLGTLTYAIYLIHRLVANVVERGMAVLHLDSALIAFALVYAGSIAAGYILHRLVEMPFIRIGKRLSEQHKMEAQRA